MTFRKFDGDFLEAQEAVFAPTFTLRVNEYTTGFHLQDGWYWAGEGQEIAAAVPVANLTAANTALAAVGAGPRAFSVPAWKGVAPSHGLLCLKAPSNVVTALKGLAGVVWSEGHAPQECVNGVLATIQADFRNSAKPLEGVVTPGLHWFGRDLWWVIQQYDTALWPDPAAVPALVRRARVPGTVQPWVQPLDQFDAYKLSNPFTGQPDRVTHNGKEWEVTQADGAGNNVNEPGVFGWRDVNAPAVPAWAPWPGFGPLYQIGDRVTHNGQTWQSTAANNVWEPGVFGWVVV